MTSLVTPTLQKQANDWLKSHPLDLHTPSIYSIKKLYSNDVSVITSGTRLKLFQSLKEQLDEQGFKAYLQGRDAVELTPPWNVFEISNRAMILSDGSEFLYKFCGGAPGRGYRYAHVLRVPKGKEIRRIFEHHKYLYLEDVEESLIALKSLKQAETSKLEPWDFVVKSKKVDLLNEEDTINKLAFLSKK